MKLVKSLLLGSAAALSTVAGVQAADLPVRKAAPVEYVQLCPAFGRGFFTIPGTDTCLSISGFARAEIIVRENTSRAQDAIGWRARARLNFDARTATAFGPLRGYIRIDTNRSYGSPFNNPGAAGFATVTAGSTGGVGNAPTQGLIIDQAYVQWGGFIAGRNTTIFSPGPGGDRYFGARFDDGPNNEQFAYVFDASQFAPGFEFAVAVENAANRRNNATFIPGGIFAPGVVSSPFVYGGQELPDFVGRLTYKGTWGYAYISGAVHQVTDIGTPAIAAGAPTVGVVGNQVVVLPGLPAVAARPSAGDEIGFAVSGSVEVNLPMLSAGSLAWVWAAYADGAISYAGYGIGGYDSAGAPGFGVNNSLVAFGNLPVADAVVVNGSLQTTEAFSVAAGFRYVFNPNWRSNIYGSYSFVDFAAGATTQIAAGPFAGARTGFVDFEEAVIAGNLIYTPVAGLDIGVEVLYRNIDPRGSIVFTRQTSNGTIIQDVRGSEDNIAGRFRVNRSF